MHDHVCSDANKGLGDAKVAEFDDGVVRVLVEDVTKSAPLRSVAQCRSHGREPQERSSMNATNTVQFGSGLSSVSRATVRRAKSWIQENPKPEMPGDDVEDRDFT